MESGQKEEMLTQYQSADSGGRVAERANTEKDDLRKWNDELEMYVQEQTIELTRQNQEYAALCKKMKHGFRDFTITISNLIELRDKTVASHSNNVAMLSVGLAKKIGLNDEETETVAVAAQLHDIGKIGISDAVLLKDVENLAPYEMEEYKTHPIRGQAVLASNDILRDAGVLIRHHHEVFGGTGYPDGLKGEAIPLGSRIIAIADTYDRLLQSRTPEKALEAIRSMSRGQLDPHLLLSFQESAQEITRADAFKDHTVETEVHPDDLVPGMVISRDVKSGTGLLLISKGVILNPRKIDSLRRHYELDPPRTGVYVWTEKREGL
jgi:HD-GYP domain-containing protein (c-di-GMP phosphodiesterase class II)